MLIQLTQSEVTIVRAILEHEYQKHLPLLDSLTVHKRKFNGHGCYIEFVDVDQVPFNAEDIREIGRNSFVEVESIPAGIGVRLTINDVSILMLECFCQGLGTFPNYVPEIVEMQFY